jgi:hypothetical protein
MDAKKYADGMKNWAKVISRAWEDDEFKYRLLHESDAVLKEEGIPVENNMHYKVLEDTKDQMNFIIPLEKKQLTNNYLKKVSKNIKPIRFRPL